MRTPWGLLAAAALLTACASGADVIVVPVDAGDRGRVRRAAGRSPGRPGPPSRGARVATARAGTCSARSCLARAGGGGARTPAPAAVPPFRPPPVPLRRHPLRPRPPPAPPRPVRPWTDGPGADLLGRGPARRLRHGLDARLAGRGGRHRRPRLSRLWSQGAASPASASSGSSRSPATRAWPTAPPAWSSWSASPAAARARRSASTASRPSTAGPSRASSSSASRSPPDVCARSTPGAQFLFDWAPEGTKVFVVDTKGDIRRRRRTPARRASVPSRRGALDDHATAPTSSTVQ